MSRRLACLLILGAAVACSPREPTNPLDPDNPDTGGAPQWLTARADSAAVDLSWSVPAHYTDLGEVRLRTGDATTLWSGPAGPGALRQGPLLQGMDVAYRLELHLDSGRTLLLPEVVATPGPEIPWIVDDGASRVRRVSPDGRSMRFSLPAGDPLTLAVSPEGSVLVVDFFNGSAVAWSAAGSELWRDETFSGPVHASWTPEGWWIADASAGRVVLLDFSGAARFADSLFVRPTEIAPADSGSVWVADRAGELVRTGPGRSRLAVSAAEPVALAPVAGGGVWVVLREPGLLVRYDAAGEERARATGQRGVVSLAKDPVEPGGVWTADRANRILGLYTESGDLAQFIPVSAPSTLAVRPDGSEVWVADSGRSALIRFTRDGVELARAAGASRPTALAVAWRAPVAP